MFELKVRIKSHWLLFYNGKEVRSGSKIFIRHWLKRFYPDVDYTNLKVTRLPSSVSSKTLYDCGYWSDLDGNRFVIKT